MPDEIQNQFEPEELPCGLWETSRGVLILFSVGRRPLFVRRHYGLVFEESGHRFIRGVQRAVYLFERGQSLADPRVRENCERVLVAWREAAASGRVVDKKALINTVRAARRANHELGRSVS